MYSPGSLSTLYVLRAQSVFIELNRAADQLAAIIFFIAFVQMMYYVSRPFSLSMSYF